MDKQNIIDKIALNTTKLQIADSSSSKQQIQKALNILRLEMQVSNLKDRIEQLKNS